MSEIRDLILETTKTTRKSRMINNILWFVVTCLVLVAFYTTNLSYDLKKDAQASELIALNERDAKERSLLIADSLRVKAENLVVELEITNGDLAISEENLQGEKAKLEEIKVKYDSLRQVQLAEMERGDDLWDYAVEENTVQSYSDYIKIKGTKDEAVSSIKTLLHKTGYLQVQESNGTLLVQAVDTQSGLWTTKSARSIRNGVMGLKAYPDTERNGDVILEGQPFVILQDNIMSGKTRWAKIAY
jgi:hypothetical protein